MLRSGLNRGNNARQVPIGGETSDARSQRLNWSMVSLVRLMGD